MRSALNPIAVHFGHNLSGTRRHIGLSQEALAFRASVHRTEVGLLERGERLPRIDTAIKLAAALGVEVGILLEGIGWTPGATTLGRFQMAADEGRTDD